MSAVGLRGGDKPSLTDALEWVGSRVDDVHGSGIGRLEDVWIDPGTGDPRWLLVKQGRFGGNATTLIPFDAAMAGSGHVWIPFDREAVRDAPEIDPGAPLTQQLEARLSAHYAAHSAPAAVPHDRRGDIVEEQAEAGEQEEVLSFGADNGAEEPGERRPGAAASAIPAVHGLDQPCRIEIRLADNLTLTGELTGFKLVAGEPRKDD